MPLHLGVTEAGMPPEGIIKTRIAFEQLISRGIGDTIRVSLTVPNARKSEEIAAGRQILADIAAGRVRSVVDFGLNTLNIISCPSCSRVENEAFIELAQEVKEMTRYAAEHAITIAVMGCRVNGPGETDDADLGLWCGPNFVNLKRGSQELGAYPYDAILPRLKQELDQLIAARAPRQPTLTPRHSSGASNFTHSDGRSRMTARQRILPLALRRAIARRLRRWHCDAARCPRATAWCSTSWWSSATRRCRSIIACWKSCARSGRT